MLILSVRAMAVIGSQITVLGMESRVGHGSRAWFNSRDQCTKTPIQKWPRSWKAPAQRTHYDSGEIHIAAANNEVCDFKCKSTMTCVWWWPGS